VIFAAFGFTWAHQRIERLRTTCADHLVLVPALVATGRAGANGIEQARPGLGPDARRVVEVEPVAPTRVVQQQVRDVVVRVDAVSLLKDAPGDQVPEQPLERIGIGGRTLGQLVSAARAGLDVVGELGRRCD
jgi:hypothetical protein